MSKEGLQQPGQALLVVSCPTCFKEWRCFLLVLVCESSMTHRLAAGARLSQNNLWYSVCSGDWEFPSVIREKQEPSFYLGPHFYKQMEQSVTADSCFQFIAILSISHFEGSETTEISIILFLFAITLKFLPLKLTMLRIFFNSLVRKASLVCSY